MIEQSNFQSLQSLNGAKRCQVQMGLLLCTFTLLLIALKFSFASRAVHATSVEAIGENPTLFKNETEMISSTQPYMVKNINSNGLSTQFDKFVLVSDTVYFTTFDATANQLSLWKSKDSQADTVRLGTFATQGELYNPYLNQLVAFGSKVIGSYQQKVTFLYATNGSLEQTTFLTTMASSTKISIFPGEQYAYLVTNFGTSFSEVWGTDGTAQGTTKLLQSSDWPELSTISTVGDRIVFVAKGAIWGNDGMQNSTVKLFDLAGKTYQSHFLLGRTLYILAGNRLWRTNGTSPGTEQLHDWLTQVPTILTEFDNKLILDVGGQELWVSDGTPANTQLLQAGFIQAPVILTKFANKLVFSAKTEALGDEPWVSDGTSANTKLLKDVAPGTASSSPSNVWIDQTRNLLYSLQFGTQGVELWKSDSSLTTLLSVRSIPTQTSFVRISTLSDSFFAVSEPIDDKWRTNLWKTDGTDTNTVKVAEVEGRIDTVYDPFMINTTLIFFPVTDSGARLWRSDGTSDGTFEFSTAYLFYSTNDRLVISKLNDALLLRNFVTPTGYELWRSDGTISGTSLLRDTSGSFVFRDPQLVMVGDNRNYFIANDGVHGNELWVTDGTAQGTQLLKDITVGGAGSRLRAITAGADAIYFSADDGIHSSEPWVSSGTSTSTHLLKDIRFLDPNSSALSNSQPYNFINHRGKMLFAAFTNSAYGVLFGVDPEDRSVVQISTDAHFFPSYGSQAVATLGNDLIFAADSATSGGEPWRSDGTTSGTSLIRELCVGETTVSPPLSAEVAETRGCSSHPSGFTTVGDFVFFTALSGTVQNDLYFPSPLGYELWRTDGTAAGTQLVKDIAPRHNSSPSNFVNFNDTLFFQAQDGQTGFELWHSDGSADGTLLVKDIHTTQSSNPVSLTVVNRTLFFVADDGVSGMELWKSDGTSAGTTRVQDIAPGLASSHPNFLTKLGNMLYFVANDGSHGSELWKSDGTASGTLLVADLNLGINGSQPSDLTAAGQTLYFAADDGVQGRELWRSEGSSVNTLLAGDINPGAGSSSPAELTPLSTFEGMQLYFRADDGIHGEELWAVSVAIFDHQLHLPLIDR